MNRCIAINKNNKKCRAKLKTNSFFCCLSHEPINKELLEDGCFCCSEKIKSPNELLYFHCKHIFHKICYKEWLQYSTYVDSICLVCRNTIVKKESQKKKEREINKKSIDASPILEINKILNNLYT
jgi:hypothetical protein